MREQSAQYKAIAEASEAALQDLNARESELKAAFETRAGAHEATMQAFRDALANKDTLLTEQGTALATVEAEFAASRASFAVRIALLEEQAAAATLAKEASVAECVLAQEARQQQAALAGEYQGKYQQEVLLHAADIATSQATRDELVAVKAQLVAQKAALASANDDAARASVAWMEQKRILQEEVTALTSKQGDLATQNSMLHAHLTELSAQVKRLQSVTSSSTADSTQLQALAGATGGEGDSGKNYAQLWDIVRYERQKTQV
jgi:nucleoprotein TPR